MGTETRNALSPVEASPVAVQELGHIVLYVGDLDRSLAFYRDVLGWPMVMAPAHFRAAGFRAGNTHHDLLLIEVGDDAAPIPAGRRLGMYHFGVKVGDTDDELRAMLAKLEAHPELVTVVGSGDHGFTHSLYVHDPDGNEIEIYIDVQGVDWDDPTLLARPTQPLVL
jgi:catechol-2,3-dioxygenase